MTATIANEDMSLREMAPLAMNHSRGTQLKSYFRKRTQERNTLTHHVRRVLGDDDDEDDAVEVSAAVEEMEADDKVAAASDNDDYDPMERPLGEQTALLPRESCPDGAPPCTSKGRKRNVSSVNLT